MKKIFFSILIIFILLVAIIVYDNWAKENIVKAPVMIEPGAIRQETPENNITTIAENLKIPWEIVFLPDKSLLITERPGTLLHLGLNGRQTRIAVPGVVPLGEGGLLGMALHPDFKKNHWLYLYFTYQTPRGPKNQVVRYVFLDNELKAAKVMIDNIPAAANHNGGRLAFGLDKFLYITTGDASQSDLAQNKNFLAGKILRLKDDGSWPEDNPFANAVYSYGHRNAQGLAWDSRGRLWATEHGRSGLLSGLDELNLIRPGGNYGWPVIQGDKTASGMEKPIINSGPDVTWAPGGAVYIDGRILFAGLRGQAIYEVNIFDQAKVTEIKTFFKNDFGRLRTIAIGPDGYFYLLTSNTDGRGKPKSGDDKIIKVKKID